MKAFSMLLLIAAMLVLGSCGEKVAGGKTEAAASAVPAAIVKELTPEEKFAETKQKAEAGDAEAQFDLGVMYNPNNIGAFDDLIPKNNLVPKDAAKAFEWLKKSADQGHANAQYQVGKMYYNGQAFVEFTGKLDSEIGSSSAKSKPHQSKLLSDDEVFGNPQKAAEWWQKAAAQGHADAQVSLGVMYAKGEGVPKDMVKAAEWWQKAAAQGNAHAQFNLGRMYYKGEGLIKDVVRAYTWFNLSAAQGDTDAKELRDLIEEILTPAQRAEGQRLASNWKKGDILQASNGDASGSTSPDGKPSKQGTGTAFAVSSAGHALTNHHVINGCTEVKVAGREGIAKIITSDSVNDLALLQLPGKVKDVASLNPEPGKLRQGEDIIVFGYPLEWALSSGGNLTPGIISALTGLGNNTNQIQITAPIQPGSSGSPVMDKKGDVVGVVSMKLSDSKMAKATGQIGQNVNFAVNGQTVRAFLDANQVPYKTGGGLFSREKSNADIAEEARKWTVLVECWK